MNPSIRKYTKLLLFFALVTTIVFTHDHSGDKKHQHSHRNHENENPNSHQHHHQHQHNDHQEQHHHDDKNIHDHNHQTFTHSDAYDQEHKNNGKRQAQLKMIDSKPHLIEALQLAPITIFFYGSSSTPEYQEFAKVLPSYNDEFFSKVLTEVQFIFIPSEKFNLTRPNPSLSIYRKINNGQWLMYRGIFNKNQMLRWITENVVDPLKQLSGQDIDSFFVDGKKGFILLDFGQFYLLKTKIMIYQFCEQFELFCGKVTYTNKVLNMIIQLMRVEKQPGIPKLGYWNPKSQQLEIYTKDVGTITENELMQLYSGHESVIPYSAEIDVAKVIHPQTDIFEVDNHNEDIEL